MFAEQPLTTKSKAFARCIVKVYRCLNEQRGVHILSKQLLRSGTSIGANIAEAQYAQSMDDFVSKLTIALKEASESEYWIELLADSRILSGVEYDSLVADVRELIRLLNGFRKDRQAELIGVWGSAPPETVHCSLFTNH